MFPLRMSAPDPFAVMRLTPVPPSVRFFAKVSPLPMYSMFPTLDPEPSVTDAAEVKASARLVV